MKKKKPEQHSSALIHGQAPAKNEIQFSIGPYQILESIAKGGMGEVFLAYDTSCGRRLALKRIRADLIDHVQLHNRFLKEARITSQLTHPAIIPIYTIQQEDNLLYYTMPFVEGETFKQILVKTHKQEKKGEKVSQLGSSIPALVRIFLTICQAVGYAHSKGVLHRDIKPENIIIGKYGEVLILDWGLAKLIHSESRSDEEVADEADEDEETKDEKNPLHQLTGIGKVVGTLGYMAPERAIGNPATIQTDIYALGVTLYQILTLKAPFQRKNLKEFRKKLKYEVLSDPAEVAPYRDVPPILSRIVTKCLSLSLEDRYQTVDEMIRDIENYLEGRSDWFQTDSLHIKNKNDWEFQENVLIAEHMAIIRHTEVSDWVTLMISKASFATNIKLESRIRIGDKGHGIGFLLNIPEAAERAHLNDGYCLWLGSESYKTTKLLRNTVEVMTAPEVYLKPNEWYSVRIEKIENNLHLFLNNILQFSYISHLPLTGTHVGLVSRDADFDISEFLIFSGSHNLMVKCLAVPDAFLANKDYTKALNEYRRIGYSFPGRAEGREAMFRAGITLLEQARSSLDKNEEKSSNYFDMSLKEFEKLRNTPGAPLEYLGKALVYEALNDYEEEIKCFELSVRRYPQHPLLPLLEEHIVYRMHENSRQHRMAAYHFILLVVRHLPSAAKSNNAKKLFNSLQRHWESLPFLIEDPDLSASEALKNTYFTIQLSFWLGNIYILREIFENSIQSESPSPIMIGNILFSLIELGSWAISTDLISSADTNTILQSNPNWQPISKLLRITLLPYKNSLEEGFERFIEIARTSLSKEDLRTLYHLLDRALLEQKTQLILNTLKKLDLLILTPEDEIRFNSYRIWALLLEKNWEKAGAILHQYPVELLGKETTILYFLYGCWLHVVEGKDIAFVHFLGTLDVSFPRTWALCAHYLKGKIAPQQPWLHKAFFWEKRQLYRQLTLYYHCIGDLEKSNYYRNLEQKEYVHG